MNYLIACEQLTEKYYKQVLVLFIGLLMLSSFLFGVIIGEYREMVYINEMINNTAYGIPTNNILKNDYGMFIIQPYVEESKYNLTNFTVINGE